MTVDLVIVAKASPGTPMRARRRSGNLVFLLASAWILVIALLAVFADVLPFADPNSGDFTDLYASPSAQHLLGTDELGRDILSRIVFGGRISFSVSLLAVALGLAIALPLGLLAGYFRGWIDSIVLVVADSMLAFPPILFLMVLTGVVGQSVAAVVIGLGVIYVPSFVRLARAATISHASREFVVAARITGARPVRILVREILPNVVLPILAYACVITAHLIVAEGTLSFLGLGIPPPSASWGSMIAGGRPDIAMHAQIVLIPSAVLFLTVLSINLVGDRARRWVDTRESSL